MLVSERLCEWVREDFGVDLVAVDAVHHGADSAADVWRGYSADGRRYAIRHAGGGTPAGLVVSAMLAVSGVAGVPAPVPARDGQLWTMRDGRRLSLVPWVSDERAYDGDTTDAHWRAYGTLLARLHATPVSPELERALPRETHTHERIAALTREVDRRLRTVAADSSDSLVQALAHDWKPAEVLEILNRADTLGAELRERPEAPYVICHTDPHLGNLLIAPRGEVWLIDWDDVMLAPPERDLMFVVTDIFGRLTADEQRQFFEAYGQTEIDPVRLAYYRSVRWLEDVVLFAGQILAVDRYVPEQREEFLEIVRANLGR